MIANIVDKDQSMRTLQFTLQTRIYVQNLTIPKQSNSISFTNKYIFDLALIFIALNGNRNARKGLWNIQIDNNKRATKIQR